jgi:hypothetical protein
VGGPPPPETIETIEVTGRDAVLLIRRDENARWSDPAHVRPAPA